MGRLQGIDARPVNPSIRRQREWALFSLQLAPLLVMLVTVAACSGGADFDFGTSRRTDLMLAWFANANGNGNSPITEVNPELNANDTSSACPVTYPSVQARLVIRNGIGATLQQIFVQFTEVTGGPLVDLSGPFPIGRSGEFDFIINTSIGLPATPLTSTGTVAPVADPQNDETVYFVPLNLYQTNIFCAFMIFQPSSRPLLARVTLRGTDAVGNPFSIVGFMLISPLAVSVSSGGT